MLLSVFSIATYAEDTNFNTDENLYVADDGTYVYQYDDFDLLLLFCSVDGRCVLVVSLPGPVLSPVA